MPATPFPWPTKPRIALRWSSFSSARLVVLLNRIASYFSRLALLNTEYSSAKSAVNAPVFLPNSCMAKFPATIEPCTNVSHR